MVRIGALLVVALAVMAASLFVGGSPLSAVQVVSALLHPHHGVAGTIVWQLRLPRVLIGAVVGAALAISGALLQGLLRNPLVDPYLTGVSAGAAVAIVAAITMGVAIAAVPALGFAAGIATAVIVAAFARRGAGIDPTRLILAGVSISSLCAAGIALILTSLQNTQAAPAIVGWLAGTLAGRGWHELTLTLPYLALGTLLALLTIPGLNAMRIGETQAAALGVEIARVQWMVLAASSLLTAAAVTLSGTVGFVGLIVPHLARRIVGADARYSVPAAALAGAALTVAADACCRTLFAPEELPIGVLLAFIGVPVFLYLYARGMQVRTA